MPQNLVVVVNGAGRGVGKGIITVLEQQKLDQTLLIYASSRAGIDASIDVAFPNQIRYESPDIMD